MSILQAFLENEAALRRLIARLLPNSSNVSDLMQETYLRASLAEQQAHVDDPRAFLFRVARNLSFNELKQVQRRKTDSVGDNAEWDVLLPVEEQQPEHRLDERRRLALVMEAIARLPAKRQRAFTLRKFDGLSYQSIAEIMGISVKTVEKHVAAGLQACVAHLAAHGHGCEPRGADDAGGR